MTDPLSPQQQLVLVTLRAMGGHLTSADGQGIRAAIAKAAGMHPASVSTALTALANRGFIARDVKGKRCFSVTVLDAPDGPLPLPPPRPANLGYEDGLADALIRLVRGGFLRGTDAQILADCVGVDRDAMYRARDRTSGHRANGRQTGRTRWR